MTQLEIAFLFLLAGLAAGWYATDLFWWFWRRFQR
jgi:hypothetical protein